MEEEDSFSVVFEKALPFTQTIPICNTNTKNVDPPSENSSRPHISQQDASMDCHLKSGKVQCNLYKRVLKAIRGLKLPPKVARANR